MMKRYLLLTISFSFFVGCQSTSNKAVLRAPGDPFGHTVKSPFVTMIENAHQPDPVLGRVYFEYDEAELSDASKNEISQIAKIASQRRGLVVVEGHTDHMKTDSFNQRLGYERALAVASHLRSEGVWDERLVIKGYGETRPATTNWKDLGRALNRCVVVRMFAQGEGITGKDAVKILKQSSSQFAADGSAPVASGLSAPVETQ